MNYGLQSDERLRRAALLAGLQDWFDVRFMAGVLEDMNPDMSRDDVHLVVIATIRDLAAEGLVTIGSLDPGLKDVIPWSRDPLEAVDRVDREWETLIDPTARLEKGSRTLDGWLSNTRKGDELARWMRDSSESPHEPEVRS